ncbi:MAG: T9SS type A sorting domain-containing protein [bacterium]|nr:T9SS type A sorting domain-containing protein [bacterium]
MKKIMYSLFFFLLTTQICFGQWIPVGLSGQGIKDIAVQDSNIFAVTAVSGEVYRSNDKGMNWTLIVDSNAVDIAISPSGKVFMIKDTLHDYWSYSTLFFSTDNGDTWIQSDIVEQLVDSIPTGWSWPRNITINPSGIVFCGIITGGSFTGQSALAKSTDDGLNWSTPGMEVRGGNIFASKEPYVLTVGSSWFGCAYGDYLYLSSDYGCTWNFLGYPPGPMTNSLGLFSNGKILVGVWNGSGTGQRDILISTNNCISWTYICSINCQVGLSWSIGFSEGMLVGTEDAGVFLFSDEGDSLGLWNEGLNYSWEVLTLSSDNNGYAYLGQGANIMFGSGGVWRRPLSEIIPVELTSFTATSNGKEVFLKWSTATETNNQGFEILRFAQNDNEWKTIGFVPGFGTTTEPKSYSYTDSKVSTGKYTYRLKQKDLDGSFQFSPETEVEISAPLLFSLEQNYPNPFNPTTSIQYSVSSEQYVTLVVYDVLGNEIEILVNEEKPVGTYEVTWYAEQLPSGVYFYRLKAGEYSAVKKMTLIK